MHARSSKSPSPSKAVPVPRAPSSLAAKTPGKTVRTAAVKVEVDLKVDSPKIREMERAALKRRGFTWALTIIIIICLGALLKITVREAFLKNPRFAVRQVIVRTSGTLSAERIIRTSALTHGMNLLTVNLRDIQARIATLPQVSKVKKIGRDYEGRLTLEVDQRQPVAWLECAHLGMKARKPETGHFIDAEGVVFPCELITDAFAALPVIRHESLLHVQPGSPLTDLQTQSALSLLKLLAERHEQQQSPQPLELAVQNAWSVTATMDDGSRITFGIDDLDEQLARLDRIWIESRHRSWKIDTLNLLVRKNMPVTFSSPPDLTGLNDLETASVGTVPASGATHLPQR
jgi:cell division septal protein FtsQ